jgi:TRAP-type C4-dicarboxylate transport system substrate-binding protein
MNHMTRLFVFAATLCFAAMPAFAQQTLKIATVAPDGSAWMRELRAAAADVATATQGRVTVKYYPGGVMGSDTVVLRKMRLGQLQGGVLTSSELAQVYPDAAVYSLPFLFDNWAQADKARTIVDPMLEKGFEAKGMKLLSVSDVGFAYVLSVKPLKSAKDVAGAKLWIPQNDEIAERTFKAGGSSPILLPLGDVFTSLQTGMVDTVPNTPAGAVALQWHGKLKNMIDLPLSFVVGFVVVDNKAFAKISAADQALVLKAFHACGARLDAAIKRDDVAALAAMKKQGLQVNEMPPAEVARWKQIGAKVTQDMIAAGHISAPLVAAIRKSNTGK